MSFDLQRVLESKRALRQQLATKPVAEKLRILDDLRERVLAIRGAIRLPPADSSLLREEPPSYHTQPKDGAC